MWATSIGSTLAQSPVSGVRKSGIPDGTETPAPVRATVHPESSMSAASRRTSAPGRDAPPGEALGAAAFPIAATARRTVPPGGASLPGAVNRDYLPLHRGLRL